MNLNRGQRVVVVIGWGLILMTAAVALSAELAPALVDDGWFNYAPSNGVAYSPNGGIFSGHPSGAHWARAAVWSGAVVLWTGGSLLVLRSPSPTSSNRSRPPEV